MGWSITLTRVRGIEIKVHVTFVLILIWAAYYWGGDGARGVVFGVVATSCSLSVSRSTNSAMP